MADKSMTGELMVIYPPEFLFVLDVGLEHLVGGTVLWQPSGYGDPGDKLLPDRDRNIMFVAVVARADQLDPARLGLTQNTDHTRFSRLLYLAVKMSF